ncbi:hypothetical protein D7V97_35750 [Corallococcus sp. CA053C]|nr:hypothetical protein D7V97_35750 [Corallococcus sp. CA053C]
MIPKPVNVPANAHYKPRADGPRPPAKPAVATSASAPAEAGPSQSVKTYPQKACPPLATSTKPVPKLALENAACLTHGMGADFVKSALDSGHLGSAYLREGPKGNYTRDADKNGGGALAVYTRAVGTGHSDWTAKGNGVGSSDTKVQLILSPTVLQDPKHAWRASCLDNGGKVPGPHPKVPLPKDGGPLVRTGALWGNQTEAGRNRNFNDTVKGTTSNLQNEQLHWEKVPLQGNLKGMVCTSQASFDTLMKIPNAQRTPGPHPGGIASQGSVLFGGERIPVALTSKNTKLLPLLDDMKIAKDNQVR